MKQFLAFDIGGTNIKYGIINEDYKIIFDDILPTYAHNGGLSIIHRVIEQINILKSKYTLDGIAISTAGVINPYSGEVIDASDSIPNYIGVQIKKIIESETLIKTEVQNDVNCFALCEKNIGNGKNCTNFLTLTVGTGIGGAIILNDKLYYGHDFSAGEWGHMLINGKKFEDVASITGLVNLANQYISCDNWNGEKIFNLYDKNNEDANKVINIFYDTLSAGIINLIYIFNPEKILIGGGISARGDQFLRELTEYVQKKIKPSFIKNTSIELTKYSNKSGMFGALFHFLDMQKNK